MQPDLKTSLAVRTFEDLSYGRSYFYYFLGHNHPWENENVPDVFTNTPRELTGIRDDILYLKRILPNDASLVIPRYEWVANTFYDQWDDGVDMTNKMFYCVNIEGNVYKCLSNDSGSYSLIEPKGNSLTPITSPIDHYIWKYMYNISPLKKTKFISPNFIPVQTALSERFFNRGSVEEVVVLSQGSNYVSEANTSITVTDTNYTTGFGAELKIGYVDSNGRLVSIDIINGGLNYTYGAKIEISDNGVNGGAEITVKTVNPLTGAITGFDIRNGGSGYTLMDTVTAVVGGAKLTPILSSEGSIITVTIDDPGIGYLLPPKLTVNYSIGGPKYGNPTPVLKAIIFGGKIVDVMIEDPGVGLSHDLLTTITVEGDGSDASFTPIIADGSITSVIVNNPGMNYSWMRLIVNSTTGSGASLAPIYQSSDFLSDQALVEQTAVKGAIYSIKVNNGGSGYTTASVQISGDGTGATAQAIVDNGAVTKIRMLTYGSNYTYASVIISGNGINASATVILPPPLGHGSNAVTELYSRSVCFFNILRGDPIINADGNQISFRQYGIIQDPVLLSNNRKAIVSSEFIRFSVTLNQVSGLAVSDILVNKTTNRKYRIISISGTTVTLQQLSSVFELPKQSDILKKDGIGNEYSVFSLNDSPSINKYSGKILSVKNDTAFIPSDTQFLAFQSITTF